VFEASDDFEPDLSVANVKASRKQALTQREKKRTSRASRALAQLWHNTVGNLRNMFGMVRILWISLRRPDGHPA